MQGKVFISYARVNLPLVERLERDLLVADVDIWRDQHEIMPGKTWDETIERALRASAAVIVVLTQASVQSQAVRNEIAVAQNMGKWVFPVRFEPCDVPMVIARLHYTDFVHDYDSGLRHLLAALNQALGAATLLAIPIPPPRPAAPQPAATPTPPPPEHRDPPPPVASTPPPAVKPPIVPPPPPRQEPVPERARPVVAEPRNSRAPLIIAAGLAGLLAVALVWHFAKAKSDEGTIPTQANASSLVTTISSTDTVTTIAQASDTAATVTTSTSPGSSTTAGSESTMTTIAAKPHKTKPKPTTAFVCEPERLPQCCSQSIDPKACRECKKREGLHDECP